MVDPHDGTQLQDLHTLQAALAAARVGTWTWDLAADRVRWSDGVADILGVRPEAFDGTFNGYLQLIAETEREAILRAVTACVTGARPDYYVQHALGGRWLEARGQVVRDAHGQPLRLEGTVCDITARKLAEAQADKAQRFSETILNTVGAIVTVLDRQGRIVRFNPAAERLTGYLAADIIGQVFWDLLVPVEQRAGVKGVFDQLSAGMFPNHYENDWIAKDGRRLWIAWANTATMTADGEVEFIIGTGIDRTREREATRRQHDELERMVAARTAELESFSYSVSHDLRSPLRAIDGYTMAVLMEHGERLGPQACADLQRVRTQAQRMAGLIDDLLALSRVGRAAIERTQVDVSAMARDLLASYAHQEPEREVRTDIADGVHVSADPGLLRIVLDNLLGNAWKFTRGREAARIALTALPHGFAISDNGAGFDMQHEQRLFQAFQRLHRADEFPGSGIGLATVQRVISRHGGSISGQGEPGRGAIFSVTLPQA